MVDGKPLEEYFRHFSGEELKAEMDRVLAERGKYARRNVKCRVISVHDTEPGPVRYCSEEEKRREKIIMETEDLVLEQYKCGIGCIIKGILDWDDIVNQRLAASQLWLGGDLSLTSRNLSKYLQEKYSVCEKKFVLANVSSRIGSIYKALGPPNNFLTRKTERDEEGKKSKAFVYSVSDDLRRLTFPQVVKVVTDHMRSTWRDSRKDVKKDEELISEVSVVEGKSEKSGSVEGVTTEKDIEREAFKELVVTETRDPIKSVSMKLDVNTDGSTRIEFKIEF